MYALQPCVLTLQAVHKQADGEPLVDVVTDEGQEVAGLPAGDCCLQVGKPLGSPDNTSRRCMCCSCRNENTGRAGSERNLCCCPAAPLSAALLLLQQPASSSSD